MFEMEWRCNLETIQFFADKNSFLSVIWWFILIARFVNACFPFWNSELPNFIWEWNRISGVVLATDLIIKGVECSKKNDEFALLHVFKKTILSMYVSWV